MFSQKNRLRDKNFISSVFKTGKFKKTRFFNVYYKFTFPPPQFLVLVSKKVSKRASQRNLIRRRTYETIKNNANKFQESIKAVLVAKEEVLGKSYKKIEEDIINAFS